MRRKNYRPLEIMESAWKVLLDKGYKGATLDEIAACAAVSKATVVRYFPNKQILFCFVIDEFVPFNLRSNGVLLDDLFDINAGPSACLELFASEDRFNVISELMRAIVLNAGALPSISKCFSEIILPILNRFLDGMHEFVMSGCESNQINVAALRCNVIASFEFCSVYPFFIGHPEVAEFSAMNGSCAHSSFNLFHYNLNLIK